MNQTQPISTNHLLCPGSEHLTKLGRKESSRVRICSSAALGLVSSLSLRCEQDFAPISPCPQMGQRSSDLPSLQLEETQLQEERIKQASERARLVKGLAAKPRPGFYSQSLLSGRRGMAHTNCHLLSILMHGLHACASVRTCAHTHTHPF